MKMMVVALGCAVVVSGCSTFDFNLLPGRDETVRERVVVQDNVEHLRAIAKVMGVKETSAKTGSDIVTDIKIAISAAEVKVPKPLPDDVVAEINKILSPEEKEILRQCQDIVKRAQGRKVLYMPMDD